MSALRHEDVARLAYQLWTQRGRPLGSPEIDWYAAKAQLEAWDRAVLSAEVGSLALEAAEGPWRANDAR